MLSSNQVRQLPVPALFHIKNYSCHLNWLAYQISLNQVRLIRFDKDQCPIETFSFIFNPEPVKQVKIIVDPVENEVYLAIVHLTKFVIYKKNAEITSFRLKLDKNIVNFQNSFVGCDAKNDQKQIYFTFVTALGEFHVVPVDNPQNKSTVKINHGVRLCSIKNLQNNIAVGDQQGNILLVDLNTSNILKTFSTKSQMPILQIQYINKRVIAATCQGQIFNLSQDFQRFTSLSAHYGFVNHMLIAKDKIYTIGDDGIMNVLSIDKNIQQIKLQKTKEYNKRANLLILLQEKVYVNFYESMSLEDV